MLPELWLNSVVWYWAQCYILLIVSRTWFSIQQTDNARDWLMQDRTLFTFSGTTLSGDRKISQTDSHMTSGDALQSQNCFMFLGWEVTTFLIYRPMPECKLIKNSCTLPVILSPSEDTLHMPACVSYTVSGTQFKLERNGGGQVWNQNSIQHSVNWAPGASMRGWTSWLSY